MFYVYVLRSEKTGRSYAGSAADVTERVRRHNTGETKSTRHGVPWKVVYVEPFHTRAEAVRRELYFKTGHGRAEWEARAQRSG